ncbi:MAG: dipeptidyl aminopeptidase/acylaminoacyl peptidase, partial [Candidatus Paceibacteria bacterium]
DEALFDHYSTTQLALIPINGNPLRMVGDPGIYSSVHPSPSGERLLVSQVQRPYSYLMPWYSFPKEISVWDLDGKQVHRLANIPLAENIPLGGVALGMRSVKWNPHQPADLLWVEALDGGDPKREVDHRDRWMSLAAPYSAEPAVLAKTEHRARGVTFLQDEDRFITSEYDRDRRWTRSLLHDATQPQGTPRILDDRNTLDRYADPGSLVTVLDGNGHALVRVDEGQVYRTGSGASPEGMLPFLDRQDLTSLETERLWRCAPGSYESASSVLALGEMGEVSFITRHESPDSPPNYRVRVQGSDRFVALTDNAHPTPQLMGITKRLVTYAREDGVPLSATLYLPANYQEGTRLPLMVWAYPREFNDPKTAGQVSSSPYRFNRIGGLSHLVLLTQGYAIMDGATMPVVGDPETMNDTFVEQIVAAAQAAIDKAVDLGVADPKRVVVGGHSYGAFMTANLLAHCDLFATGVARSGAYNRTLTPFGFQSERRTFWEAPDAYFKVSPFMHAHKINEPLLMIHGEIDNNSGTFPLQSERLFQAIKGNGGTARLVMLPFESHGYRARESVLHVQAETIEWFDRFLNQTDGVLEASSKED